jgi:hypothetical protein
MVNRCYGSLVSMEKRVSLVRASDSRLVVFSQVMRDDGKIFGTFQLSVSLKRFFKLNSIRGTLEA